MPAGKHEPVAVRPVGVARVVPHHLREEHVRQRGEGHRGSRVAVSGTLRSVHGETADDVDPELLDSLCRRPDRRWAGGSWRRVSLCFRHEVTVPPVVRRATVDRRSV